MTVWHLACHWRHGRLHSQPKIQQKDQRSKMEHRLEKKKKKGFRKRIPKWKEFLPFLQVWYMHPQMCIYMGTVTRQSQITYQPLHGQFLRYDWSLLNPKCKSEKPWIYSNARVRYGLSESESLPGGSSLTLIAWPWTIGWLLYTSLSFFSLFSLFSLWGCDNNNRIHRYLSSEIEKSCAKQAMVLSCIIKASSLQMSGLRDEWWLYWEMGRARALMQPAHHPPSALPARSSFIHCPRAPWPTPSTSCAPAVGCMPGTLWKRHTQLVFRGAHSV